MAQGRPPRHSKSKRDPVTIDGKAERVPAGDDAKAKANESGSTAAAPASTGQAGKTTSRSGSAAKAENTAKATTGSDTSAKAGTTRNKPDVAPDVVKDAPSTKTTGDAGITGTDTPQAKAASAAGATPAAGSAGPAASTSPSTTARPGTTKPGAATTQARPESDGSAAAKATASAGSAAGRPSSPAGPSSAEGGGARGFVAGLVGGIIAVIALFLLQEAHVLPVPGQGDNSGVQDSVSALGNEVDSLKQSIADLRNTASKGGDTASQMQALDQQVETLAGRVDKLASSAQSKSGADSSAVDSLKGAVARLQSGNQDLATRVDKLSGQVSSAGNQVQLVKAIAAMSLKSAIDRGGSFATELQAYASVAPDDSATAGLKDLAADGVPSREALQAAFPKAEDAILSASSGDTGNDGVFGHLLSSARSLVKVRPTGDQPGDAPDAVAGRMGAKLKAGDLQGVVDAWNKLPEAAQKASQSFIDKVKARVEAERLASAALKRAMPANGNQG